MSSSEFDQPPDDVDIGCHHQVLGTGTLVCRAAKTDGKSVNSVSPTVCAQCDVGKIYREVGCDAASPNLRIYSYGHGRSTADLQEIFCKVRKRYTSLEYCRTCNLVTAETTRQLVSTTRGLFQSTAFFQSYKDLEKARTAIRDGDFERALTASTSALESTLRQVHETLSQPLPSSPTLTQLWKSTRSILRIDEMGSDAEVQHLANALTGLLTNLAGLRNALSDAHGRGSSPPDVSEAIAEVALNTSATVSTLAIRRLLQVREKPNANT